MPEGAAAAECASQSPRTTARSPRPASAAARRPAWSQDLPWYLILGSQLFLLLGQGGGLIGLCGPRPALKFKSTPNTGKMNAVASSFCASRPRERDGAGLRSSVAAALQPNTQLVVVVASLAPSSRCCWRRRAQRAAPRGGTRRHLEGGRELRAASAPSQKHQLGRSSRSRRRQCPATMSGRRGFYWAAPRISPPDAT